MEPFGGKERLGKPAAHPWDGFLAGPENELAVAIASAAARGESAGISPLVLHGPSGVGKTRILQGLTAERLLRRPESSIAFVEGDAFATACREASARRDRWEDVRDRYRRVDLFVLDNLDALDRSPVALEELSHTLDALEAIGAIAAFSSKEPPGRWSDRPARLVNRFLGGLSTRIDPPSLTSRRRYVLEHARSKGISISSEAAERLAEASEGYRDIEGRLARLALTSRVERKPIDRGLVEPLLQEDGETVERPTVEAVAKAVAAKFGVSLGDLRSESRRATVVEPRHLAILLARRYSGSSLSALGAYFGGRDKKTVRHACEAAAERLAGDPAVAAVAESLARSWSGAEPPRG